MPMRLALAALFLGACIIEPPPDSGGSSGSSTGWGSGYGGGGGTSGYGCESDSACGTGYVCARDGECLSAASVHIIHVDWTIKGQPASDATCINAPKLDVTFQASTTYDQFGFSPVPCNAGRYTIDKMPTRFTNVTLARAGDGYGGDSGVFDADGNAQLDLPY